MPDQPQPTSPPPSNNNRITAMLQDLAAQRAAGGAPTSTPPVNLPVTPSPRPPVAPMPPMRPVSPALPQAPGISVIPQPKSPPPAPKEAPVAPMPPILRPPAPPSVPIPPKPVVIVPTLPPAPVLRPKAPLTTGRPAQADLPTGQAGTQGGYSAELRTMSADIANIKVGQAPAGIRQPSPSAPAPVVTPVAPPIIVATPSAPVAPAIIVVPSTDSPGGGFFRKMIYGIVIALVLISVGYALISLIGGDSTPQETATPSPSLSVSPAPTLGSKNLRSYFGNPGTSVNLQGNTTGKDDLHNALISVQPPARQATSIAISHQGTTATAPDFFNDTLGSLPADLNESIGSDWALLAYGQSEGFDQTGTQTTNANNGIRLVVLVELTDATKANQAMQVWETTGLASASAGLFQYDTTRRIVSGFSGGTYRQIPLRYWNFPYADRSIDYAIVTASNNKNYLILSGSREAIFFAIDQLMQ